MTTNSDSAEDPLGGTDRNLQLIIDTIPALGLVGAPRWKRRLLQPALFGLGWPHSRKGDRSCRGVCVGGYVRIYGDRPAVSSSWSLEVHWQREVRQPHGIQRIVASSRGAG